MLSDTAWKGSVVARPVLVTGAAGFVGQYLIDELQRAGQEVVGWYRPDAPPPHRHGIAWRAVDLLDRAAVGEALASDRPQRVYHLAAAAHVARSWEHTAETLRVNVLGTHCLIEAIRILGDAPRILVTSSSTVYRPSTDALTETSAVAPPNPYALSKLAQEALVRGAWTNDGVPTVIARAFNHVGPGQSAEYFTSSFARQVAAIEAGLASPTIEVGNLDAARDLTDVRDTVRAYVALMERGSPGTVYNVCSGRPWVVRDVLDFLVRAAHVPVSVHVNPSLLRPNDVPCVKGSFERLSRETGWTPSIALETTLKDLLDYWRHALAGSPGSSSAEQRG